MSDPNTRLAERLHGIAGPSMAVIIGNMIQEMIFELQIRESQDCSGSIPFTLTDEEREAIKWAAVVSEGLCQMGAMNRARTLLGILERLG